jgi:hypothetical protein
VNKGGHLVFGGSGKTVRLVTYSTMALCHNFVGVCRFLCFWTRVCLNEPNNPLVPAGHTCFYSILVRYSCFVGSISAKTWKEVCMGCKEPSMHGSIGIVRNAYIWRVFLASTETNNFIIPIMYEKG